MFKYFLIIFSLFIIACGGDSVNSGDKEDENPCETYNCENAECKVDIGANTAYCKCNEGYVFSPDDKHICIKKEADLCINKQCAQNEECNSQNGNCECKSGFIKKENECVEDITDLCADKQCSQNEECNSNNGICECKLGFERVEGVCEEVVQTIKHAVMIYGDNRDHIEYGYTLDSKHPRVVSAMMREFNSNPNNIEYIFNSGDLVYDGNDPENEQWDDFFSEIKPFIDAGLIYYPVLGNHEHNSQNYFDKFVLPENERYYHLDLYGVRFIVLDSNSDLSESSDQYIWLLDKLDNVPTDINFVIAIYHHPLYSTGHHGDEGDKMELREILQPLFVEKKVDLVFNGHDHAYEHLEVEGVDYIVTGGGGALLDQTRLSVGDYEYSIKFEGRKYHYCLLTIEDDKLTIEAKEANDNNEVFDTIVINRQR